MNDAPDPVPITTRSRSSRSCCTSTAISVPYAAVAMRHPPWAGGVVDVSSPDPGGGSGSIGTSGSAAASPTSISKTVSSGGSGLKSIPDIVTFSVYGPFPRSKYTGNSTTPDVECCGGVGPNTSSPSLCTCAV